MNVQLVQSIWSMIQALSQEERGFLRSQFLKAEEPRTPASTDLNQFSGVIGLQQDPLEYQRQMRDEWA